MNRTCNGVFFSIKDCPALLYRCMYDGSISAGLEEGQICPRCERIITGRNYGECPTETVQQRFVLLPFWGRVDLPLGDLSNARAMR